MLSQELIDEISKQLNADIKNYKKLLDIFEYVYEEGMGAGKSVGMNMGMNLGKKEGREQGFKEGVNIGLEKGLRAGLEKGGEKCYQKGFDTGYQTGFNRGYEIGLYEAYSVLTNDPMVEPGMQRLQEMKPQNKPLLPPYKSPNWWEKIHNFFKK